MIGLTIEGVVSTRYELASLGLQRETLSRNCDDDSSIGHTRPLGLYAEVGDRGCVRILEEGTVCHAQPVLLHIISSPVLLHALSTVLWKVGYEYVSLWVAVQRLGPKRIHTA